MPATPQTYSAYECKKINRYSAVAATYGITPVQAYELSCAMRTAWETIAADWLEAAQYWGDDPYDFGERADQYIDEAAMIAEATLDSHAILTYGQCSESDLAWVYRNPNGTWRRDAIEMGAAVYRIR